MTSKKLRTKYACQECGYQTTQWLGKCPSCQQWNTLVEEQEAAPRLTSTKGAAADDSLHTILKAKRRQSSRPEDKATRLPDIQVNEYQRWSTQLSEFDRVLGGGAVEGGFVLIGGDPGIGKSTLMLQALEGLSKTRKVLYVTGEESPEQVKLRAQRLGISGANILLAAETCLERILKLVEQESPEIIAIDSIQTMFTEAVESAPGSVSQVRDVGAKLMHLSKQGGVLTFLVGHVTKEGAIAGPRVLEHMVDTVLYFESAAGGNFRILRAVKNRFGSTNEVGVFEMDHDGLREIKNPSALFLGDRRDLVAGACAVSSLEGTRPLLLEVQALVAHSHLPSPRRTTLGVDHNRTSLLLAVMEKKWDLSLADQDVYINVAGGMRVTEPSSDLGVMAAVVSSFRNRPVPRDTLIVGEVGLAGEVRAVSQLDARIREAVQLGFKRCLVPSRNSYTAADIPNTVEIISVREARELRDILDL